MERPSRTLAHASVLSHCPRRARRGPNELGVQCDLTRANRGPKIAPTGLKGKTPEQTITAMLAVGSKPGGRFKRVDKGTYALAEDAAPPEKTAQARVRKAKPGTRARQSTTPAS